MTLKQLCEKYSVSESSVKTAFPRTQKAILKKFGVKIGKVGRGSKVSYFEEEIKNEDSRALTMFEENKEEVFIDNITLNLLNLDFLCFIALVLTPMLVFRGSFGDFCKYMEVKDSKENIAAVKGALSSLEERDLISYNLDKTNKDYFVAAVYRQVEEDMKIGIDIVRLCKEIADQNNKRSWIPLLKTWLGMQLVAKEQPFTIERLVQITGLSEYQVKESKKLLEQNNVFKTTRAYKEFQRCIGMEVDLNIFYLREMNKKKNQEKSS